MTEPKTFYVRDLDNLTRCIHYLQRLTLDVCWKVRITLYNDAKTREQEEKYHAMIGEIAVARPMYRGLKVDAGDWKRILIDMFARYCAELGQPLEGHGRVVPSLDGAGTVQLGVQSRGFNKKVGSDFIEFLYSYAAHADIRFKEPKPHGQ